MELAFVALVATSSALLADDLTQPTAAVPTVIPELESPAAVPLDPTIETVDVDADFPSGTSPQSELIAMPRDTTIDATVEVKIRSDFNELRREILEDRMKLVDWWLAATAIFLTLLAVIVAIIGLVRFKRLREIEIEARKGVEITNSAAEVAISNVEEAKKLLREIESNRDKAVLHTEQITSMFITNEPDKANKAARSAKEDPSMSSADRAISAAILLQRQGDIEGATRKWRAIAKIAGGTYNELAARAWFSVGYLHAVESRFQDAIASFDEVILLKTGYAEAYVNRGHAKCLLGRYDEAISDHDEAIRLKPDDTIAFNNRGIAKGRLGRYDEAISDYDEAIRLKPNSVEAYFNRGNAKGRLGRYDEAISDYDEAIRLKPDAVEAYFSRGDAKSDLNRYDESIFDYNIAIRLKPDDASVYRKRALAFYHLERTDEAISDYGEAIRLKPDDANVYCQRALMFLHLKRTDEARQDFEVAHKLATAKGDQLIVEKVNKLVEQFFGGETP